MPFAKIKTIILAILIAVNLLLLAIVVPARQAEYARQESLRTNLQTLFAEYDVILEPERIPQERTLYPLLLEPDEQVQLEAAKTLLGSVTDLPTDGGRYATGYTSERGTCQFARNGDFSAELTQPLEASTLDLGRAAERLLDDMGYDCAEVPEAVRQAAGVYTVTARQTVDGVPVFSSELALTYSNNTLTAISGVFFTGSQNATQAEATACITVADTLIAFLNSRDALGWVGGRIHAIEQGYFLVGTASASTVRLNPVWRIRTDTGAFLVNCRTAEVSAET